MASDFQPKPEKSYLSATIDSITPSWGMSRNSTPKPKDDVSIKRTPSLNAQQGGDHSVNHRHGLSLRHYPKDCPPLNPRWYFAVDVPKRKPKLLKETRVDSKPLPAPKKFVTFSSHDSRALELAYQNLVEETEDGLSHKHDDELQKTMGVAFGNKENTSIDEAGPLGDGGGTVKVPVNEDFLFDVDIERRELAPVYWLGPIYEVRRGSWFYQEGSVLRPCEENLALQLEEGYLKIKPYRYPKLHEKTVSKAISTDSKDDPRTLAVSSRIARIDSKHVTPKSSTDNLRVNNQRAHENATNSSKDVPSPESHQPQTHRLFGSHMNSIVTYQDDTVAWISSDGIMSRVSSTVYQRFAGGGYLGGVKCVRGYKDSGKTSDTKIERPNTPNITVEEVSGNPGLQLDERQQRLLKRRSAPPSTSTLSDLLDTNKVEPLLEPQPRPLESRDDVLDRQVSSIVADTLNDEAGEEAMRKQDEKDFRNDYAEHDKEDQSRKIDHLILVTHGIGQRLGMRTESVNFVHDVNVLRQTLKSVYSNSADLQALNSEIDRLPKNCRVQVLPVCWRHLLDFPQQGLKQNRKEHDLGDTFGDDDDYPSLEDITIEGAPFVRSLITDLALDVLLYQSEFYRSHISTIVLRECNRIWRLFMQRNENFDGKISLLGHSLGSAILFDILAQQKEKNLSQHQNDYNTRPRKLANHRIDATDQDLEFDVEDFYCIGSPIGLFQMLKGRTIAARHHMDATSTVPPLHSDNDPFLATGKSRPYAAGEKISSTTGLPLTVSSPRCAQIYNISYSSDVIAYRLEPLISPAMASLRPQALPYTKKGIFGASTSQGLTGISAKVGQSVSGLWSSLSGGIASSLLNRSLGLTGEDVANMAGHQTSATRVAPTSSGAGTNVSGGVVSDIPTLSREDTNEKKRQLAENTIAADQDGNQFNAPTLIDDDIETLYAGFQKRRKSQQDDEGRVGNSDWAQAEEKSKRLRREEVKVRALNQTGRVDFTIQEYVHDHHS